MYIVHQQSILEVQLMEKLTMVTSTQILISIKKLKLWPGIKKFKSEEMHLNLMV